ncbi:hypothetical protein DY218_26320 [Streptomyces triticagri]|uniref:Helix-hairpin-helix domain-containing protein n=1 Tax=Streptomyces triticagri TaxID=2293568 RepID=A0A372LZM9_9ACTN|nr:hypothetical protein [Streptomyces triticagri]RFU83725.1 hypothetical protein DY218_26320 [Streptomyces triticagri]
MADHIQYGKQPPVRVVLSMLWTLIPLATVGFGTVPMMMHAAARTGQRRELAGLGLYGLALLVFIASPSDGSAVYEAAIVLSIAVNTLVAFGHAVAVRREVWYVTELGEISRRPLQAQQRAFLAARADERAARGAARSIAASDPALAHELRIGQAELRDREFPDGGLIDVNNVPPSVLTRQLNLSIEGAQRAVRLREATDGFSSAEEMSVLMDLPPHHLDTVADRLVFLPPRARPAG